MTDGHTILVAVIFVVIVVNVVLGIVSLLLLLPLIIISFAYIVVRRLSSFLYLSIYKRTLFIQSEVFVFVQEMIMSLTSFHVSYILFLYSD